MKNAFALIAMALTLVGCGANAEPSQVDTTQTMPADHPPIGASEATTDSRQVLTGRVAETLDGGGYTYMRITSGAEDTWVAVPKAAVEVGQDVTVSIQMTMTAFESTALNRTFESLSFATMGGMEAAAPHGGMPGMGMGMGQGKKAEIDLTNIRVEKAEGSNAKTVADLWAQRTELADSNVVVRGKVVKFLPSIMGRNWVHLRDGTGTDATSDNDITVTTNATVAVGDIVTAKGIVRVDKDLGAGYTYPVILEDGTFTN